MIKAYLMPASNQYISVTNIMSTNTMLLSMGTSTSGPLIYENDPTSTPTTHIYIAAGVTT